MIKLDGSYGEGGGSLLRMALALSSVTLQPFEIVNIRRGRPNPGLQPQHLACIKALEELCNASSEGAELNSTAVRFFPGKLQSRTLSVDIGTAGSVTLLLQALLLPALFAPGKVRLKLTGGTNVSHSQPVEYFSSVFLPHLGSFGKFGFSLMQRGYFPKGSGRVELEIKPLFRIADYDTFADFHESLQQQNIGISMCERGKLLKITGVSHASADLKPAEVAERQAHSARVSISQQLQKQGFSCPVIIQPEYSNSQSTGSGVSLFAHFAAVGKEEPDVIHPVILGSDSLGERSKRAEAVGQEAAAGLIKEIASGACVDHYLADQLVPLMAIAGNSKILTSEITNHCLTNIFVVEKFLRAPSQVLPSRTAHSTIGGIAASADVRLGKCFEVDEEKKLIRTVA